MNQGHASLDNPDQFQGQMDFHLVFVLQPHFAVILWSMIVPVGHMSLSSASMMASAFTLSYLVNCTRIEVCHR